MKEADTLNGIENKGVQADYSCQNSSLTIYNWQ